MTNTQNYLYPIYVRQGKSPNKYKAGFINAEGEIKILPDYEDARSFSEGLAPVRLNGKWGAIALNGDLVIPCTHTGMGLRFSEGTIGLSVGMRHGAISRDGNIIVPPKYWAISQFSEGTAYIWDGKQYWSTGDKTDELHQLWLDYGGWTGPVPS